MQQLASFSTRAPKDLDKKIIKEETTNLVQELIELQNLLYAERKHSILKLQNLKSKILIVSQRFRQ